MLTAEDARARRSDRPGVRTQACGLPASSRSGQSWPWARPWTRTPAWLAARLAELGVRATRHITVDDEMRSISAAITDAALAADVVVVSGGLGPTDDDLTRAALAQAAGEPLVHDAASETTDRRVLRQSPAPHARTQPCSGPAARRGDGPAQPGRHGARHRRHHQWPAVFRAARRSVRDESPVSTNMSPSASRQPRAGRSCARESCARLGWVSRVSASTSPI